MKIQTQLFVVIPVLICMFLSACSSFVARYDDTDIPTFTAITGIKGEVKPLKMKGSYSADYPCANKEECYRARKQYIEYLINHGWVVTSTLGTDTIADYSALLKKDNCAIWVTPGQDENGNVLVHIYIFNNLPQNSGIA